MLWQHLLDQIYNYKALDSFTGNTPKSIKQYVQLKKIGWDTRVKRTLMKSPAAFFFLLTQKMQIPLFSAHMGFCRPLHGRYRHAQSKMASI